jgi:PAS domain S-box-containing protein
MGEPDDRAPSLAEAFGALQHLADMFLGGGSRLPAEPARDDRPGAPPATLLVDAGGVVRGFDGGAERLFGRPAASVLGSPVAGLFGPLPAGSEPLRARVQGADGASVSVSVSRSEMAIGGDPHVVFTLLEGSSGRTELRYQHLVEQIPAVVFTAALDGGLYDLYVSPQIESLLGYSQREWVADPVLWYDRLHPDDRRKLDEEFARGCATGGPFRADCRFLTRDDKVVWVHGEARLIKDARGVPLLLQGVAFDITDTKRAEEVARASLREKETLLKEVHHRVKNNLQVTSSLLRLQADGIEDQAARMALRQSQDRIRSMALVHELLYRSKDLSRIDLGEYVRDLMRQLVRAHSVERSGVRVDTRLTPVLLPIDVAVPCGLILNEVVTNALDHAFPGGRPGTITIELSAGDGVDELVVRDDGVGLPPDFDPGTGSSLGLRLIRALTEQIDGELTIRSEDGTEVRLHIPHEPARPS